MLELTSIRFETRLIMANPLEIASPFVKDPEELDVRS